MVILALDTSTRAGSLALWREDRLLTARPGDPARLHAVRLPDALEGVLREHALTWQDVTRLAVLTGPGGFTGLRVGLATVKGLAMALSLPVVALPTLDVLAWAAHRAAPDCPVAAAWMQGMRGEIFTALYEPDSGHRDMTGLRPVLPALVDVPAVAAAAWRPHADHRRVAVAGDAWAATGEMLRATLPRTLFVPVEAPPLAGLLAELAAAPSATTLSARDVLPTYVRRPDAVMQRLQAGSTLPDLP
jgi:tRNA threonylcarbamoyladenosine biosynthesis protein TsaB